MPFNEQVHRAVLKALTGSTAAAFALICPATLILHPTGCCCRRDARAERPSHRVCVRRPHAFQVLRLVVFARSGRPRSAAGADRTGWLVSRGHSPVIPAMLCHGAWPSRADDVAAASTNRVVSS